MGSPKQDGTVLDMSKWTNTLTNPLKSCTIPKKSYGVVTMSETFQMDLFENLENEQIFNLSLEDFLAKASALLESVRDLPTLLAARSFMKSSGSHLFSDLEIYFLKTSRDYLTTTKGKHSRSSSERWMKWGMTLNGKCITARPTFPKTESVSSLSDILEDQVPEKYFLSDEKTQKLLMSLGEEKKEPSDERIAGWVERDDRIFAYRNDDKRSTVQEHVYIKPEGTTDALTVGHVAKVIVAGNVNPSGNGMNGQVFDAEGLAPTLTTNKGEGNKILINVQGGAIHLRQDEISTCIDANYAKGLDNHGERTGVLVNVSQITGVHETDKALCLDANYFKGLGANQARTGVLHGGVRAVLTPDRPEKRQNGRRMKEPGEPMFTLTAQDKHGVAIIDDQGRTTKELRLLDTCPTLRAQSHSNEPKVYNGYRIRKLTPLECFRLQSYPDWWYVTLKLFRHPELIPLVDMSRNDITAQVAALIGKHHPLYPDQMIQVKEGMSDSQLYKMAGNGVTSAVAEDIGRRMIL